MTRRRARKYDQAAYVIFLLVTTAACASIVAIGFVMGDVESPVFAESASRRAVNRRAPAVLDADPDGIRVPLRSPLLRAGIDTRGSGRGLNFPGVDEPAYFDFAYYSFVLGMTSQVSDVSVTTAQMRRTTLAHGVLSFVFNIAVLAMSINVIGGVI